MSFLCLILLFLCLIGALIDNKIIYRQIDNKIIYRKIVLFVCFQKVVLQSKN